MKLHSIHLVILALLVLCGCSGVAAQTAEDWSPRGRGAEKEEQAKTVKEMLSKMQADQAKKQHSELLERGQELLTITAEIEKSFETSGQLSARDREKLENAEKLAKKIRGGLGGDDDDEEDAEEKKPTGRSEVIKYLRAKTVALMSELKKTSRFTVSAAAIQSSNAVLKLVRFLKAAN